MGVKRISGFGARRNPPRFRGDKNSLVRAAIEERAEEPRQRPASQEREEYDKRRKAPRGVLSSGRAAAVPPGGTLFSTAQTLVHESAILCGTSGPAPRPRAGRETTCRL